MSRYSGAPSDRAIISSIIFWASGGISCCSPCRASSSYVRKIDHHRPLAVLVANGDASQDVRAQGPQVGLVLAHQLPGPLRIVGLSRHDLHESRGVRVPGGLHGDLGAVLEGGGVVEQLLQLRPPLPLLGPVAVGFCCFLGLEPDQRKQPTVLGYSTGGTEPAGCRRTQVGHPPVQHGTHGVRIRHLASNDLSEHVGLLA